MRTLIKNVDIVPVDGQHRVLHHTNIAIKQGRIALIGEVSEDFHPDIEIEGHHLVAIPGLINTHTHLGMSLLRHCGSDLPLDEWLNKKIRPIEKRFTEQHIDLAVRLSIAEMIRGGITTCGDMYFNPHITLKAVADLGVRVSIACGLLEEMDTSEHKLIRDCVKLFEEHHRTHNDRIRIVAGPHAIYTCSISYLTKLNELLGDLPIGIHTHVSETIEEVEYAQKMLQSTPLSTYEAAHLMRRTPFVVAHGTHFNKEDLAICNRYDVSVAYNPSSNMKLASGWAPIAEMQRKEINIALGTDGVASNNNLNMFEEMNLAALLNKGRYQDPTLCDALTVLEMATINGARALGWEQEIGSLEEGKQADIVLINKDRLHNTPNNDLVSSLVYSSCADDVNTVMVGGEILYRDGEYTSLDVNAIMHEARQVAATLIPQVAPRSKEKKGDYGR